MKYDFQAHLLSGFLKPVPAGESCTDCPEISWFSLGLCWRMGTVEPSQILMRNIGVNFGKRRIVLLCVLS